MTTQTAVVGTQIAIYLEQLKNVSITSPVASQGLVFNGTNWVNQNLASGGTTALANLSDVNVVTPTANQVLTYSGGHWINAALPSGNTGTVTATAGALTLNALVLGAGTVDTKAVAGITTDGVSILNLGVSGTSTGSIVLRKVATGSTTIVPANSAGTFTWTLPAASDQAVGRTTIDTLTNKTLTSPTVATPTVTGGTFTGGTFAGVTLTEAQAQQASAPSTNNSYTGFILTGPNAGATIAQWQPVYMTSAGTWALATGSSSFVSPCRGLAIAAGTTGNPLSVIYSGRIRNDSWTWTPGGDIYVDTSAGVLTQSTTNLAGATGNVVQKVGWALTATVMVVNIGNADYFVTA